LLLLVRWHNLISSSFRTVALDDVLARLLLLHEQVVVLASSSLAEVVDDYVLVDDLGALLGVGHFVCRRGFGSRVAEVPLVVHGGRLHV
jgi:hypothetical protein